MYYDKHSYNLERWYCHHWVPGVYFSLNLKRHAVMCTEVVAGSGPVEYESPIFPGEFVVTDLTTGYRHVLPKTEQLGLV